MIKAIIFISVIVFLISLGIVISLVYFYKKDNDEEELLDGNFVINLMSPLCKNRAFGIEKSAEIGNSGRYLCTYTPADRNFRKLDDSVEDVTTIVGKCKRVVIPVNDWSSEKSIVIYFPPKVEYLPEFLKKLNFGEDLMKGIEFMNAITTELNAVREGSERKSEIAERMGDGEWTIEKLNQLEEEMTDRKNMIGDGKNKKDFSAIGQGN